MKNNSKSPELADIFAQYGNRYREKYVITGQQYKVMKRIEICRTAALGGHVEACDHCGHTQNAYNSCRDRHCPKCQTMVKEKWLNNRKAELLPCSYFHNVFTLPHELNPLIKGNKRIMLALLFTAVKKHCRYLPVIHSGALKANLALSPCSIHGARNSWTIITCTALSQQEHSPLIVKNGSVPALNICSRCNHWRRSFRGDI